jgi:glutaminyl-tRNA synthetase
MPATTTPATAGASIRCTPTPTRSKTRSRTSRHSICTLEFADQRPFYDWLLERLAEGGLLQRPLPQQIEFSRLNLTYIVLSKRKLIQLVEEKHVAGWDDPRLPTLVGARRRGYPAEGFRLFAERIGVSFRFADRVLATRRHHARGAQRIGRAPCRRARPAPADHRQLPAGSESEECLAPNHPLKPELGKRAMPFGRELWIEREDFMVQPSKGYHRLYPGNMARLRYGYVVKCTGFD